MKVSAVLVTRGDVSLWPVLDSLNEMDEVIVWDNSVEEDLSVYGRYAAIERARNDLVYTQDDDCIVSDPAAIVNAWMVSSWGTQGHLVCNMPQQFRHDFYTDHALVGFGSCFHRDLPAKAFGRAVSPWYEGDSWPPSDLTKMVSPSFLRTCDVVFTCLTPRILVDVPYTNREFASDPNRMWRQNEHQGERQRMLDLVRRVRDA